ncbi:von Willebrand factor A domain-containing protein 5A-like [Sinocyclocheilus rhinocerous]|uniref:von Willebrand factor A domain-containing protein 5A-like n=1 Tax=Sinocyclocheilus rhinocerous TaxID=307959 RepID=UPI0007B847EB|nr:PREDICTED: von Willebrand factor A domain-containing protein 5A-like [Sinocyclocheilus rhinocerous]
MEICGLVTEKNEPVPLKSISVEVLVQDHVATVSSTLQYVNEEERPLEALFVFPLPADAAVCHFSAKIGEQEIVAEVQDRETARDRYDDAVSSGQQAFLLEESTESPDVFRLSVGCLSAGQNAAVTIIYVTELAVQADHSLRFCLPAVLNPRYTPAGSAAGIVSEISSGAVPYTLTLSLFIFTDGEVGNTKEVLDLVKSHTHSHSGHDKFVPKVPRGSDVIIGISRRSSGGPEGTVTVKYSLKDQPVTNQLHFCLKPTEKTQLSIHRLVARTLIRSLEQKERSGAADVEGIRSRIVELSVQAGVSCVHTAFIAVNKDSRQTVKGPLKQRRVPTRVCPFWYKLLLSLQLFVFTDGEVGNTKEVLDLVKSHTHSHRCFSLGIGEGASAALITGMAREGSGHAQFITDTDRMQPKVMQSLRFALQPAVLNISVDWTLPDDVTVDTLSPPINVLFQGQRTLIYAQLKGESSGGPEGTVTVKYSLKDQPVTNQLHFCLKPTEKTQLSIHRLVARTLIRSLEQKERSGAADVEGIRSRMVELSVQAGVSSVHTAFIAVNKDSRQTVKGPLLQRRVRTRERGMLMYRSMRAERNKIRSLLLPEKLCREGSRDLDSQRDKRAAYDERDRCSASLAIKETQKDPLLQLVSLQKASGCWDLDATLADVFGKTEDELTNQKPAQVDGSVWATLLALIWLYGCKIEQQVEWQFVAMKAASWIGSQKVGDLSQCVCLGNVLLGCQVTKETLGICSEERAQPPPPLLALSFLLHSLCLLPLLLLLLSSFLSSYLFSYSFLSSYSSSSTNRGLIAGMRMLKRRVGAGFWGCTKMLIVHLANRHRTHFSTSLSHRCENSLTTTTNPQRIVCVCVCSADPEPPKDTFLQLVSLQTASGCWDLDATLADVFGKTEDELTNQKPAQVDGSVWATLLALIWLYGCKIEQQVEWQFVAMKAASWIGSQKVGDLSQCVCGGNVLLGCQVTKETLGI